MQHKQWLLLFAGGILLVGAIAYGWWRYQESQWTKFSAGSPKLVLEHPTALRFESLTVPGDSHVIFLFRASEGTLPSPLNISLRSETGLRLAASLTRQDIIPMLLRNAERAHPQRFTEYQLESEREYELAGKKAAELLFTYVGPAGEKIEQRFLVVAYDGDTAIYLTAQARESDFDELNQKYFSRMFESLRFE